MKKLLLLILAYLLITPSFSQELKKMEIIGKPQKLTTGEMVARRDQNGNYCAAIQMVSYMSGLVSILKSANYPGFFKTIQESFFCIFVKINNRMPELTIKYRNNRTLQLLTDLAKYFDFEISPTIGIGKSNESRQDIPLVAGDSSINIDDLTTIFTGKNLDAQNLRKESWTRS
jgi:hypothetical protein